MKLKFYTEQVLTVLLVVILLPCAITLLLNSRMSRIYQAIQDETKYISIESGDKTEEISLEEYVLEVTASELPADAQLEGIKAFLCREFQARKAEIEMKEDRSLIGGFILQAGGREYDWSLRGRYRKLEQKLTRR